MSGERENAKTFADLARSFECDEDEAHWEDRLRKIARQKPADEPPAPVPTPVPG